VREEWARAAEARLDVLLTSRTVDDTAHAPALWGPPQGAAWCARPRTRTAPATRSHARVAALPRLEVLLNELWADMLSGLLQRIAPAYVQEVLSVYLNARDAVPIPDFITDMRVVSLAVGARCPFGIRAIRVATKDADADASADLVLDVDIEVLSSDADVTIHAVVNDLVAPLLARWGLRPDDASYIAINISDVRLTGTLRVRVAPTARIAALAFREVPTVALGLTLAYHSKLGFEKRFPVTALPGVAPMMEMLVAAEVAEYAVWPRFFAADLAPPALLGLRCAPPRGAPGRLRVTLRGVRGLGGPQRAQVAAEAADAAAKAAAAAANAAAKGLPPPPPLPPPAPRPVVPFAVMRWSTGLHSHRTGAASSALDADGAAAWAAAAPTPRRGSLDVAADAGAECFGGETFVGDVFSPFGLEFLSLELRAPGWGRLGAAQVKLQAIASGETLFSFAGPEADAHTALPRLVIGEPAAAYDARTAALLPGRSSARGVTCSEELNVLDAWVPLDGMPGAAVHLRVEIDWLREGDARDAAGSASPANAAAALAGATAGGLAAAVAKARGAAAARDHTLHVAVLAARGLPAGGAWAVAIGRAGDWRGAARTRTAKGATPAWDDAFELRQCAEAPVVTLIQLKGPLQPGAAETPLAAAPLPSTQLRSGDAAAMWLTLQPLPGSASGPVEVLLRAALCASV
jgi:hypothetical protein